jgi:hypothetical protein
MLFMYFSMALMCYFNKLKSKYYFDTFSIKKLKHNIDLLFIQYAPTHRKWVFFYVKPFLDCILFCQFNDYGIC